MAFENLFIRKKNDFNGVKLDAVIREDFAETLELTKNPIENGVNVADHVIYQPRKYTLVGLLTDTPLGFAAFGAIVDTVTGFFSASTSSHDTRSTTAYKALVALKDAAEPLTIQTGLGEYKDMVITSITTSKDKTSFRSVPLQMTLEEAIITESQVVQVPTKFLSSTGGIKNKASKAIDAGRKAVTAPIESAEKTITKTVADWVGGLF
jgi:hypothetical protein